MRGRPTGERLPSRPPWDLSAVGIEPDLPNLAAVAAEVRAWNAIAVVGAGLSVPARLPMSAGLDPLLWQAFENSPEALADLRAQTHLLDLSAKATVEGLGVDRRPAWEAVARNAGARERFQRGFAALDAERRTQFSRAHDALAEMVHRRHVELVVSLNWDTQLEAAWSARYGQPATLSARLAKPHGDAAHPEDPWVLPGEMRPVAPELSEQLAALVAERPRVLLVIGYSEADERIVQELIAPLEKRWTVVRIGPRASGELALETSAESALPRLRSAIEAQDEAPAWSYVRFAPQHDLGRALSGRSLGPHDVAACPAVPEVSMITAELRATGCGTIIGESGAGKSLAAAHAAQAFWSDGFEVVELVDTGIDKSELRQSLLGLPRPVVAILDDAQRLAPAVRRELLACGGRDLCVIAALNGAPAGEVGVRLDATRATASMAAFIRTNRDTVLPIVQALDSRIGDGPLDEPLEDRLEQALSTASSPWQLAFILTGGWKRIRGDIAELRNAGGYDLLVGLVGVVQLLRRGGNAAAPDVRSLAEAAGRDQAWVQVATEQAVARRLLSVEGSTIRLPHLRFAEVVLSLVLANEQRDPLLDGVAAAIDSARYEIWGIQWLLDPLFFADRAIAPKRSQLSPEIARHLVARCWRALPGNRGAAAYVLNSVRRLQPETVDVGENAWLLGGWISDAGTYEMPGIARFLNDTYNENRELLGPVCDEVQTAELARRFQTCTWPDPYFFGELLGRLALGPERFRERMNEEIDHAAVTALFNKWPQAEAAELSDLTNALTGLASFNHELALDVLEQLTPAIAENWQPRFAYGYSDLLYVLFLIGFPPAFLRHRQPNPRQRRIARALCEGLDPAEVARAVSSSTQREWQGVGEGLVFIGEATPRHAKRIAGLIDWEGLDAATAEFWPERVGVLLPLVVGLAQNPGYEPAASWVARHIPQMLRIDPLTATLAPEASAERLRELGALLDLRQPSHDWETTALALRGITKTDPDVARDSFVSHRKAFTAAFGDAHHLESAETVITILEQLDSSELRSLVAAIDPKKAAERWSTVLRGKPPAARRAVAHLIAIALEADGPIRAVALDLRQRFPAAAQASPST